MIYLRSSRRGASQIGVGAGALDHDYIDALTRLTEPSGLRLKIEASNGTELQGGIKSTTLSARLFATDGTDLTAHLAPLLLTWEVGVNGAWQEVGKGWSYQAGLRNELRSTYRISTTHLEVTKALGETVTDAGSRRILQELVITEEVVITNSHALFALIPTADLLIDGLKRDRVFLASVKGERGVQGIKGADGKSVTVSEVTTSLKQDSAFLASVKGERGVQGLKGADGKSVTVSEVTTSLKQDSAFLASVKGERGERGVQGIKGADGTSVTPQDAVTALLRDQASLTRIRSNVLESNDATQFVKNRIKKEVIQAYTLSASNNVMRLPSIYTIEDGATYRIAIINNSSCMISFNIVAEQEIITPMFESLGYNHDQKALFCKGAFALFERLGDRWLWRNYCDYAYYEDDAKKLQKELRLSNIEDNITELKNGSTKSFINLNSINTGSYKLKPDDHIIFARETGNGDRNPWIYLDNPNIKIGAIFYIIVPREDILCEFKLPSGASAFGNTKVRKGMHMLIKTWTTEWIITSMTTI